MVVRRRNKNCVPNIAQEGEYHPHIPCIVKKTLGDRLFRHQTLSTARKCCFYKSDKIPLDSLDFMLDSAYVHGACSFTDKIDPFLQPETVQKIPNTFRRLRNTVDVEPERYVQEVAAMAAVEGGTAAPKYYTVYLGGRTPIRLPYRYHNSHELLIGGIVEVRHPMSIKLMHSSHHAPQTNAGYSRQDADGTFFHY